MKNHTRQLDPPTPRNVEEPVAEVSGPLRAKAVLWMRTNPEAYQHFVKLAIEKAAKEHKFGINQLREVFRWHYEGTVEADRFKFCNSYSPYVARQLIADHPHLADYMRCRRTKDEQCEAGRTV